jgi:hypothetical protein
MTACERYEASENEIHSLEEAIEFAKENKDGLIYIYPGIAWLNKKGEPSALVEPVEIFAPEIADKTPESLREFIRQRYDDMVNP